MTAHSLIATGQRRTQGNIKETQPRRRFVDLTQFGFKFADWNKWSFEFVGITFTLIPRPGGGWQVEDHPLSFDLNTKPILGDRCFPSSSTYLLFKTDSQTTLATHVGRYGTANPIMRLTGMSLDIKHDIRTSDKAVQLLSYEGE